jgi:hypothetical protein
VECVSSPHKKFSKRNLLATRAATQISIRVSPSAILFFRSLHSSTCVSIRTHVYEPAQYSRADFFNKQFSESQNGVFVLQWGQLSLALLKYLHKICNS